MPIITSTPPFAGTQVGDKTVMANQMPGLTNVAKINAAIVRAKAINAEYVYLSANMFPFDASQIVFDNSVFMVREGHDMNAFDITAYGADPLAVLDSTVAINAAISAAVASIAGNIHQVARVYAPSGTYAVSGLIAFPPLTNSNIEFTGAHWRSTVFAITTALPTAFRWGSATRDASGSSANTTLYGKLANITITANLAAIASNLLDIVEADGLIVENVLVQNASTGKGIRLLGSVTSGGYAASSGPQVRGCEFRNVKVVDCLYPLYLENAEDNAFFNCEFRCKKGSVAGANTVFAIEFKQAVGNRFYRCYASGDTATPAAYVGIMIDNPVQGLVFNNEFYGALVEGCSRGFWVNDAGGSQAVGNTYYGNFALNTLTHLNNTIANGTRIFAPTSNVNYYARRAEAKETIAVPFSASVTFDATQGDFYQIGGTNTAAWTLNTPTNGVKGQFIEIEFQNNSGGVMQVPTLGAFKTNGALVMPANANRRVYGFHFDNVNWRETFRAAADQPN